MYPVTLPVRGGLTVLALLYILDVIVLTDTSRRSFMGLFDAIGGVISTALTNSANKSNVEATNNANKALWEEQTAYNAPEAQMSRLQAAGLNPNLVYGQIAESRAGTPPTLEAPHADAPPVHGVDDALSQYQQVVNMQALNSKVTADAETAKANAIKAASDAKYSVYENESLEASHTLRSDPSLVKEVGRGVSFLGGYVKGVWDKIDASARAQGYSGRGPLLTHSGDAENANASISLPIPDGGQ